MKNILMVLLLASMGLAAAVHADTEIAVSSTATPSVGTIVFQLDGETSFPQGQLGNTALQGWGPEISGGYRFPQNITLSLETGYVGLGFKGNQFNTSWDMVPVLLKGQYNFSGGLIQPYVFLGAGLALNFQSSSFAGTAYNSSEVDFLEEGGLGISFSVIEQIYLFIQTKIEIDNTSSHYAPDQPTILIPVDVGLVMSVN
ncbi:MAG TPA: outer membrane beta-barrel protein [bacterium]|jgi:hypothetical protein|nr:outer membrane beta-barrel protein [bacterium]